MDAEPKALRPYILLTTAFVVIGTAAGFLIWMLVHAEANREGAPTRDEVEADPRPVEWPQSTPAEQRERLTALVAKVIDPRVGAARTDVKRQILEAHENALPALLNAVHAMETETAPGKSFDDADARARFLEVDGLLMQLRTEVTPADAAGPAVRSPDARWVRRRARTWFAWWDRVRPSLGR